MKEGRREGWFPVFEMTNLGPVGFQYLKLVVPTILRRNKVVTLGYIRQGRKQIIDLSVVSKF